MCFTSFCLSVCPSDMLREEKRRGKSVKWKLHGYRQWLHFVCFVCVCVKVKFEKVWVLSTPLAVFACFFILFIYRNMANMFKLDVINCCVNDALHGFGKLTWKHGPVDFLATTIDIQSALQTQKENYSRDTSGKSDMHNKTQLNKGKQIAKLLLNWFWTFQTHFCMTE